MMKWMCCCFNASEKLFKVIQNSWEKGIFALSVNQRQSETVKFHTKNWVESVKRKKNFTFINKLKWEKLGFVSKFRAFVKFYWKLSTFFAWTNAQRSQNGFFTYKTDWISGQQQVSETFEALSSLWLAKCVTQTLKAFTALAHFPTEITNDRAEGNV
jgi:hypothetical protein